MQIIGFKDVFGMFQLKAITKIVAGVALMILAITSLIAWVGACFGTVIVGVVMLINGVVVSIEKVTEVWLILFDESLTQIVTLCCPSDHVTVVMFVHDAKVVLIDIESFEYQHVSMFDSVIV